MKVFIRMLNSEIQSVIARKNDEAIWSLKYSRTQIATLTLAMTKKAGFIISKLPE